MKTKITALVLIAITGLALTPKPALANDKGLAVLGGFIGGMIAASAINDHHYDTYPNYDRTVIVDRRADFGDRCDEGYWQVVNVRVWVPGYWIVERSHHGRCYRRYVEGHNEYRADRVWVAPDRRDRRDRDFSSGYDRR